MATGTALKPPATAEPVVSPVSPVTRTATTVAQIPILRMSSAPSAVSIGAVATAPPSMFGEPVLRSEDPRFLRGEGRYLDNVEIPGALHAAFVRSIMPHARIDGVDVSGSLGAPGVVGAYVADDLDLAPLPPSGTVEGEATGELEGLFSREPLARTVVRFVGEISRSWWPRRPARRSMPRRRSPSSTSRSPS